MAMFINVWKENGAVQECVNCGKDIFSFEEMKNHTCGVPKNASDQQTATTKPTSASSNNQAGESTVASD